MSCGSGNRTRLLVGDGETVESILKLVNLATVLLFRALFGRTALIVVLRLIFVVELVREVKFGKQDIEGKHSRDRR